MRKIELLAPAKNLECGMAAIEHGADAVYIGARRFGARAAAGNSVNDIATLCSYAHIFGAKVYVTVNTILYDDELEETLLLLEELDKVGVDAVLVQDMALLEQNSMDTGKLLSRFNFDFHASTQTDNRTEDKVRWLSSLGFTRVVLARELSLEEITSIHDRVPDVELEVFVHGALCVSYSGVCYASQHCFGRSANRGECAQFCRLKFDLKDSEGKVWEHQRHLLSLRDLCQIDNLEKLLNAGVSSLKIEGRLKDVKYVKNVVAAYSQRLNEIISKQPGKYCRASRGYCTYTFSPNLRKTFNRGFTDYFLNGRRPDIVSFDTPKAMGEYVGKVKEIRGNSFNVAGMTSFANGDGICFINGRRELEGFRVNRVEGNRLYPLSMPSDLRPGVSLYRNNDIEFERVLTKPSAVRKIPLKMVFSTTESGFMLSAGDVDVSCEMEKQPARTPQYENLVRQLSKLGNTPYVCDNVEIVGDADKYFVPSSQIVVLRRQIVEKLMRDVRLPKEKILDNVGKGILYKPHVSLVWQREYVSCPYLYNISNHVAARFYERMGLKVKAKAFELEKRKTCVERGRANERPKLIMQCRYCLRYSLGYCVKRGGREPYWREPLYLELSGKWRFRLEFNCKDCQMNIYTE